MKVSIIVPVYNVENVLCHCVDSILAQTFTDFELILVDDGSTDKSGKLCDKYADKNEKVIAIHIENGGVSKARNTGIELAKGEYICFIDSDDYINKRFLEELANKTDEGYDFVLTAYQWVNDYEHNAFKTVSYQNSVYSKIEKNELMDLSNQILLSQPWNKIFKREILIDNNIRMPEELSLGEDTVFVYRYLSCIINESFCVINNPLYYYFSNNSDSLLNMYREDLFDVNVRLNNYLYNEVKKWELSDDQLQLFYNACYYRMESVLFNTLRKENKLSFFKKIKYNNFVLKSDEFIKWVKKFKGYMSPIYKFSFSIKSFFPMYLLTIIKYK